MNKKEGVICLGESLVDFIPMDKENTIYQKCPGGAPANVAVGVSRLGGKSSFLGKVGDDLLGRFLRDVLNDYHVETSSMILTKEARTGAVFVTLSETGERSFEFYIQPSADQLLKDTEVNEEPFMEHAILHLGSISTIHETARKATMKAVHLAKDNGMLVSYDPNLRMNLWESEQQARDIIHSMLNHTNILKISEEELAFLTGREEVLAGIEALMQYEIDLIFVTLGSDGSYVFRGNEYVKVPAMRIEVVDTTGAGDAYMSGVLYQLNQWDKDLEALTKEDLERIARFASVSGALAISTKGAMTALPEIGDIERSLSEGH
ncbi:aminoimidazole riboside kinase [Rossellomorea aquimaris]|uniref:aminoimidazole riboside kinase n=1 Tax=Rossellomorea aquimaris TaxID=189382 RepID=UPI0005C93E9B|nr:aminoimidazole riboside kinase [Rossellomorea aquimaris]